MRIRPDPPVRRPGRPRRPPQAPPSRRGANPLTYERMREFDTRPAFRARHKGVANLLALGIVLGAIIAVVLTSTVWQHSYADRIYPRVTVDGYSLSGKTPAEARAFLQQVVDAQTHARLTLHGNGHVWTITAAQFGAHYNVDAVVNAAYALGHEDQLYLQVIDQIHTIAQETSLHLQASYDRGSVRTFMQTLVPAVNVAPIPAIVGPRDGTVAILRASVPGQQLDVAQAVALVANALDTHQLTSITLPVAQVDSAIDDNVARAAVDSTRFLLAGPVTFTYGNTPHPWILNPPQLARLLTFTPVHDAAGWSLRTDIDIAKLSLTLRSVARAIAKPPHDASYFVSGSSVGVLQDLPGSALDVPATARAILALQTSQSSRLIYLPTRAVSARFSVPQATALNFNALMAQATVSWATLTAVAGSAPGYNNAHDVAIVANHLDNLRLQPGAVLTYTTAIGPINAKSKYYPGLNKLSITDVAGVTGAQMQVASALYNAAYKAGLGILQHTSPPTYTVLGGQIGLEALAYDMPHGPNLVIKNTTAHQVLVKMSMDVTAQTVTVYLFNTQSAVPSVSIASPIMTTHPDGRVDVTYSRSVANGSTPPQGNDAVTHYAPLEAP